MVGTTLGKAMGVMALLLSGAAVTSSSPAADRQLRIEIEGRGTIVIQLAEGQAPRTTARVIDLANQGFYNGQRFHKVVRSPKPFLVQIGDPNSKTKAPGDASLGSYSSGTKVPFEKTSLRHVRGAVGFARLDNDRNSGDTQFYILLDTYAFLDGQYTVFGNVVEGLDLLDSIQLGDRLTKATIVQK